jgi:hypothetical protein
MTAGRSEVSFDLIDKLDWLQYLCVIGPSVEPMPNFPQARNTK